MSFQKLLIANRGEIAIRIARAAGDVGLATVAIYSADDAQSMHARAADAAYEIPGRGARAYLDIEAVIAAAKATECDAVHPGYGFLSENSTLARRCVEEGIVFVGPSAEALDLFGDKAQAKALAKQCGVPIIDGTSGPTSLEEATAFFDSLGSGGAVMIKAIAGGGGRGMRIVDDAAKLEEAYARCQSEAMAAFGSDGVYVERLIRNARHIEVQIICDHHGAISHLWERECTIQRRNQKLIEVAPSPSLSDALRMRIIEAAKELAAAANYDNLGTFEFLVDNERITDKASDQAFAFIEANPRLQVEHTVTEAVLGLDLVQSQLAVAAGATLGSLGLAQGYIPKPRGFAMQLRVNMEVMDESGGTRPTGGTLAPFDLPAGPGVRVDTFGYSGYRTSAAFELAACQGDRPRSGWRLDRRRAQGIAYLARISHRRRRHQHSFPRGDPGASGFRREPAQHRLHRYPRCSPGRRGPTGGRDGADRIQHGRRRRCARSRYGNGRGTGCGAGRFDAGSGAAAGHYRRGRCPGRGSRPSRPTDRRARIHEDGASGDGAAWRQGDQGRG